MRDNLIIDDNWRKSVIKSAWDFVNIIWIPTEKNLCHGKDKNGEAVNIYTPDIDCLSEKSNGWWRVNEQNQGMPYKWGGFSTIEEFQKGIAAGKYAGNVPDFKELGNNRCVGVDCSGLVSRCWGLQEKHNTEKSPSLISVSTRIKTAELLPGDILLRYNQPSRENHVVIFVKFTDSKKSFAQIIIPAGSISSRLSIALRTLRYRISS